MRQLLRGLAAQYNGALTKHPILTKTVSAVLIAAAGDVICQKMQGQHGHTIDWPRTGRMAAITGMVTPGVHYWYTFLIHKFPTHALKRMLADQVSSIRYWASLPLITNTKAPPARKHSDCALSDPLGAKCALSVKKKTRKRH